MKTTKVISPKVVVPKDNKKISKLPEDVQKLLADWEEFEKNLEKKRKQEMKDLRRNRGKSLPTTKGAQQNGSVHPPVQNEKKKDKEINQEETEKSEDGKVRPWKLRLNETKNSKREDYISYYKTIKENQETKGEHEEKKKDLYIPQAKVLLRKESSQVVVIHLCIIILL